MVNRLLSQAALPEQDRTQEAIMVHPFDPKIFDHDATIEGARRMRDEALGRHLAVLGIAAGRPVRRVSARAVGLSLTAAVIATAAFWAVMLTSPPRTEASVEPAEVAAPAALECLSSPPCP
jgi:hypothetical protein